MSNYVLDELLRPYDVIAIDCGSVLHITDFHGEEDKINRDIAVQEMKALAPLLNRLSKNHVLVLVCNSTKKKIFDLFRRSGLGKYFDKMYIAPNKSPKVPRLEKVMLDYKTDKIILLDDKMRNINDAKLNHIPALQITYPNLLELCYHISIN